MRVVFILLLASSCAQSDVRLISPESDPAWLIEAVEFSVDFWEEKGIGFEIGDGGLPIQVRDTSPAWGFYEEAPINHIEVSDEAINLSPVSRSCIVSHELFHHLGAEHVGQTTPSLMNPIITICADEAGRSECCWSDLDQTELDRVLEEESYESAGEN